MGFVFGSHNPLVDDFTKRIIVTKFGERRANIGVVIVLTPCISYILYGIVIISNYSIRDANNKINNIVKLTVHPVKT